MPAPVAFHKTEHQRRTLNGQDNAAAIRSDSSGGRGWHCSRRRIGFAQGFPSQDVHFICAFPAGSGADVIVRFYAEKLRPIMGRNIIVENRVGAIGDLATQHLARSKPDGHTMFLHGASAVAANMHLFKKPAIDAGKEIRIAATLNRQPTMMVVAADKPWKSVAEVTSPCTRKKGKGDLRHLQSGRQNHGRDLQGAQ